MQLAALIESWAVNARLLLNAISGSGRGRFLSGRNLSRWQATADRRPGLQRFAGYAMINSCPAPSDGSDSL